MNRVIIVDGFSTGKHYAAVFRQLGYQCIHLHSNPSIDVLQHDLNPADYEMLLVNHNNEEEILKEVKKLSPAIVIPGCESGVELADYLSEKLALVSNGTALSLSRRNKFYMQEQIKKAGLRSIKQFKTSSLEQARDWLHEQKISKFIVKPLRSAGTNLFHLGYDDKTLQQAFKNIINQVDIFNYLNQEDLVQECIEGQEYAINTVSYEGKHYITDICKYKRILTAEGNNIYDKLVIEPFNIPQYETIKSYVFSVLSALGINYGPAHSEIFLTTTGPVLVETGARLMGASIPEFFEKCMGHSQLSLAVKAYIKPKEFLDYIKASHVPLNAHGMYVFLIASEERLMKKINYPVLSSLRSYYDNHLYTQANQKLIKTKDLISSPGVVYLCHENNQILQSDYQKLREYEKDNLIY